MRHPNNGWVHNTKRCEKRQTEDECQEKIGLNLKACVWDKATFYYRHDQLGPGDVKAFDEWRRKQRVRTSPTWMCVFGVVHFMR